MNLLEKLNIELESVKDAKIRNVIIALFNIIEDQSVTVKSLQEEKKTVVFYESVHRIQKTISQLSEYLWEDRQVVIARELTKIYEEFYRWTLKEASEHFTNTKGEFVVILPAH